MGASRDMLKRIAPIALTAEFRAETGIAKTAGILRFVRNATAGNRFIIHVVNVVEVESALIVMASVIDRRFFVATM